MKKVLWWSGIGVFIAVMVLLKLDNAEYSIYSPGLSPKQKFESISGYLLIGLIVLCSLIGIAFGIMMAHETKDVDVETYTQWGYKRTKKRRHWFESLMIFIEGLAIGSIFSFFILFLERRVVRIL